MIYRFMYMAYPKGEVVLRTENKGRHVSIAKSDEAVFLYYEANDSNILPEEVVQGTFKVFPDGSCWKRLMEIFHYSKPQSDVHWERKIQNKTPWFRIMYLKPEMVGSYIFYHFQFQEEYPGEGDKYGAIYIIENMLIMYLEQPTENDDSKYKGLLKTQNTPKELWGQLMSEHFIAWENGEKKWKTLESRKMEWEK